MDHVDTGAHRTPLEQRLAALRAGAPQRSLDARALAALAANPGCRRRAVLDAAGVDKSALATRLGSPAPFGQSPFAITRGLAFEKRITSDGFAGLLELLRQHLPLSAPFDRGDDRPAVVPDLVTDRTLPEQRIAATRVALARAAERPGVWTILDHPLLRLDVAGSRVLLEPDVIAVRPDGRWTVVEIKSFPILDGSADPAKVGAAARQAAVYVLALRATAAELAEVPPSDDPYDPYTEPEGLAGAPAGTVLLVCPKDFSNRATAAAVDVRKPMAVTRRQLDRLTRIEQLLDLLPAGTSFDLDPDRAGTGLDDAVGALDAAYAPDCLAACELAFHCRSEARCAGAVEVLGRGVRGELGSLRTVEQALAAADPAGGAGVGAGPGGPGRPGDPGDAEAAARLARAAGLRAEALAAAGAAAGGRG
ncbi:hypothetical protein GXW83_06340 [Streptacidiphilus sp. PB12-B1b]|uniref:hypothetical protein n=1 Tax=Streptacidiphilus sp. PB12-B1b TaxID=2705012 RepID=UPI0015F80592|nr:hypothetical protein [Streptacidiphilus sp. PB12-B1b]QMU75425.1 hypothetical protein GXW83_06340 [Streptacidiphilus sp. PB12-B1b]